LNLTLALISGLGLEAFGLGLETPGLVNIPASPYYYKGTFQSYFCRAMLCVSAAALYRRAVSVRLSVLLSDTFLCCIKTSIYILKLF